MAKRARVIEQRGAYRIIKTPCRYEIQKKIKRQRHIKREWWYIGSALYLPDVLHLFNSSPWVPRREAS